MVDVGGAYGLIRMTWRALARRPLCTSSDADVALHVDLSGGDTQLSCRATPSAQPDGTLRRGPCRHYRPLIVCGLLCYAHLGTFIPGILCTLWTPISLENSCPSCRS